MSRYLTSGILILLISWVASTTASENRSRQKQSSPHKGIACAKCHKLSATSLDNLNNESCLSCHDDKNSNSNEQSDQVSWTSLFHSDLARLCADCHFFHEPTLIKTTDGEFTVSDNELTAYVCQTCHLPGQPIEMVSAGHRQAAANIYHSNMVASLGDSPSNSCLTCHSEHGFSISDSPDKPIAISVAASHAFGVDVKMLAADKRVRKIEDKTRLFNNKVECQSCHTLSSGTADALVEYENQYDLCYGCHAIRG